MDLWEDFAKPMALAQGEVRALDPRKDAATQYFIEPKDGPLQVNIPVSVTQDQLDEFKRKLDLALEMLILKDIKEIIRLARSAEKEKNNGPDR